MTENNKENPITEQIYTEQPEIIPDSVMDDIDKDENNQDSDLFYSNSTNNEEEDNKNQNNNDNNNQPPKFNDEAEVDPINSNSNNQTHLKNTNTQGNTPEKPKKEISPELAAFLEDMPFGLGKDLSSRVRKDEDHSGIRPNLPSAKKLKEEQENHLSQRSPNGSPIKKPVIRKKIVHPKPKTPLEEALDLFSNPSPFSWQQKPKDTTSSLPPRSKQTPSNTNTAKQSSSNIFIDGNTSAPNEIQTEKQESVSSSTKATKFNSQASTQHNSDEEPEFEPQPKKKSPPKNDKPKHSSPPQRPSEDLSIYLNSASKQETPQKPQKDTVPKSNDDTTMTFLTGLTDDQAYTGTDQLPYETPPLSSQSSSHKSQTTRVPKKKRMNYAMMSFLGPPKLPVTKPIDITKYEYKDADFDVEGNIDKIPPKLLDLLDYPHESLTFHALCGSLLPNVPSEHVSRVVLELKKVMQKTTSNGLIAESLYVQNIQDDLKNAHAKKKAEKDPEEYKEKLEKVQGKLDRIKESYNEKIREVEEEENQAMNDLEEKFQYEAQELDNDWNSEHMQNKFNKPSAKLIDLRNEAKVNLKAHRFQEAILIANEIAALEEQESGEAGKRMADAYNAAAQRLQNKYEADKTVLNDTFAAKKRKLQVEQEQSERPFLTQMEKYSSQISQIEREKELEKRRSKREETIKKGQQTRNANKPQLTNIAPIQIDGKLKLPPLPTMSHSRVNSALNSTSMSK